MSFAHQGWNCSQANSAGCEEWHAAAGDLRSNSFFRPALLGTMQLGQTHLERLKGPGFRATNSKARQMKRPVASSTVTTAFGAIRFRFWPTCEAGRWWLKLQFHPPLYANAWIEESLVVVLCIFMLFLSLFYHFSSFFSGLVNGRHVSPLELVLSLCSAPILRRTSVQGSMKSLRKPEQRLAWYLHASIQIWIILSLADKSSSFLACNGWEACQGIRITCVLNLCAQDKHSPTGVCKLPTFGDVFWTNGCRYSWSQAICWLGDHGSWRRTCGVLSVCGQLEVLANSLFSSIKHLLRGNGSSHILSSNSLPHRQCSLRTWIFIHQKLCKFEIPSFMWLAHSQKMSWALVQRFHVQLHRLESFTRPSKTLLLILDQCRRTSRKTSEKTRSTQSIQCMSWPASQWYAWKVLWDLMIHRLWDL